jgi:low affinity Fe/Cu permease
MSQCPPADPCRKVLLWTRCSRDCLLDRAAGSVLPAALTVVVWACTGPLFGFSDTWQLVINTGTTIVTFLIVFLIQNSQNRDTVAIHLKLDEILRSIDNAKNEFTDIEDLKESELEVLREEHRALAAKARDRSLGKSQPKPKTQST